MKVPAVFTLDRVAGAAIVVGAVAFMWWGTRLSPPELLPSL